MTRSKGPRLRQPVAVSRLPLTNWRRIAQESFQAQRTLRGAGQAKRQPSALHERLDRVEIAPGDGAAGCRLTRVRRQGGHECEQQGHRRWTGVGQVVGPRRS